MTRANQPEVVEIHGWQVELLPAQRRMICRLRGSPTLWIERRGDRLVSMTPDWRTVLPYQPPAMMQATLQAVREALELAEEEMDAARS